jgi:hypothetical protein
MLNVNHWKNRQRRPEDVHGVRVDIEVNYKTALGPAGHKQAKVWTSIDSHKEAFEIQAEQGLKRILEKHAKELQKEISEWLTRSGPGK